MSAIFGILRFDGTPVSTRDLERMGDTLAYRGPDSCKFVAKNGVGLGHRLMRVNQEDRFETQPLFERDANITLVADLRLDNREQLANTFGLSTAETQTMPDSAFVMRAYQIWGEDCAAHLLGDFAFALWDGRGNKLVLARDHMGQRPLFYHRGAPFFAFATDHKALWALPDVPYALSETSVSRTLVLDENKTPGVTLFEGIVGLPGGTVMTVTPAGDLNARRYWEPHADPEHIGRDEAYYVEAHRRLLGEAVACRLRRAIAPAALCFSGGFDSAAIAALAGPIVREQGRKLIAVTSVAPPDYSGPAPQARPWVELCRRDMPHLDVRYTTREGRSIFTGLEKNFLQGLPAGPHHYAHDEMFGIAAAAGARIVMDGHGGDYTLNPRGSLALARWLVTGQLRRFIAEFGPWRRHRHQTVLQTIKRDVVNVLAGPLVASWRRWRNGFGSFTSASGISMRQRIEQLLRQQQNAPQAGRSGLAALHGLMFTRPFHDKRVVELGLAIPETLYVKAGRPRALARAALADLYPPEFQDRPVTNDTPTPDFRLMVQRTEPQLLADIARMENDPRLARYFDFPRMRRMLAHVRTQPSRHDGSVTQALTAFLRARYLEWFQRGNSTGEGPRL